MKELYRVGEWDEETLGNHRLLIQADDTQPAVHCMVSWRRSDFNPEKKGVFIRPQGKSNFIKRVHVKHISQEELDLIFEPVQGVTTYEVYYMRFEGTTRAPYSVINYLPVQICEDASWVSQYNKVAESLPQAELIAFESCSDFHSYFPMEIPAGTGSVKELTAAHGDKNFLIFPEVRENSIKMRKDLPHHWVEQGPFASLSSEVFQGEYYVFQLGVFAHRENITINSVSFSFPKSSGASSWDGTCFNLEGVSYLGESFTKDIILVKGEVQALWAGVQIPDDISPSVYTIDVTVETVECGSETVTLKLDCQGKSIVDKGDDDPYRLSRLRWLNSTIGSEDAVISPYIPVTRSGDTFAILGRDVTLGKSGLPHAIHSYYTPEVTSVGDEAFPILGAPMEFSVLDQSASEVLWSRESLVFQDTPEATQSFSQVSSSPSLEQRLSATIEPDGCLEYSMVLSAKERTELKDVSLSLPFHKNVLKYMLGLGFKGGAIQDDFEWSWNTKKKNQDSLWIGCERGGVQVFLSDDHYNRPLNTNFYHLQPLVTPVSWDNQGKGRITFKKHTDYGMVTCSSGDRVMEKGESLVFNFRLLITPFRPIDTYKQWNSRFIHEFKPLDEVKESRANVVNIHHAKPVNPFINYPFLRTKELKEYIDEAHDMDMRVRLYYTIRELTNHAPELFALRSLGHEVFSSGPGGGQSWLQEHLYEDYIAAWHVFEYGCCAIANTGSSRWTNFYLEGLDWLTRKLKIDGVYIDDLAFGRGTMKRMRRVLDTHRTDALIDLHSANQFNDKDGYANSINMYMENLPYIDRLWFGEYFEYDKEPEYWMTEVAGIPFGLMGEMLQDGGHIWRGMLYGMTSRYPHETGDPRRLWEIWNDFGISDTEMYGYWSPNIPVVTPCDDILTTVYLKPDGAGAMIAVASWNDEDVSVTFDYDWEKLGMNPDKVIVRSPYIERDQEEAEYQVGESIPIKKNQGAILIIQEK